MRVGIDGGDGVVEDEKGCEGAERDDEGGERGSEARVGGVDKNGKGERASVPARKGEKTTRRGKEARNEQARPDSSYTAKLTSLTAFCRQVPPG